MQKIETEFTRMIDIDYPIIGAPMFLLSYEELAVAVANAGGLGTISLPNFPVVEQLRVTLNNIRRETDKPIGTSIQLHTKVEWKKQLALCLDAGVKFFITALGDPRLILKDVHANGGKVFASVISLEQGLKARDRGVDGLVAVATGAGGHCGKVPTIILVPYLRSKTGLPVVAAGGVSTGAQMAAAMAIGACAVIVGTRLIATTESRASMEYKKAVLAAGPEDIVCTDQISMNPANWIAESIKDFETMPDVADKRWRDFWSAGQSVAQTEEIKPAGEVIREMVEEYMTVCERLGQSVYESKLET
ncbi:MAG: nitronate monooxygenase [Pseudomonadota bacterium]